VGVAAVAVSILRRLFGGRERDEEGDVQDRDGDDPTRLEETERTHELELARNEQERLDDLQQRQLRYQGYAWEPPAQGGERRADDVSESE
jgi:hypothetical protein